MTALPVASESALPANESTCTERRLAANRQNAQLSTGPQSDEGKAKSSLNAVKSALTGRTVLLPSEDAAEYQRHGAGYIDTYKPVGLRECELVQFLSDTMWRLQRISGLEMAIYARGNMEFAGVFDEHPAALRAGMIELQTFLKYEKQLRNLQLQEARLQRRYENDSAELRNLQRDRAKKEETEAASRTVTGQVQTAPANGNNGFDFSTLPEPSRRGIANAYKSAAGEGQARR